MTKDSYTDIYESMFEETYVRDLYHSGSTLDNTPEDNALIDKLVDEHIAVVHEAGGSVFDGYKRRYKGIMRIKYIRKLVNRLHYDNI